MDKATIDHFPRAPSGMHDALNDDTLDEYQDHLQQLLSYDTVDRVQSPQFFDINNAGSGLVSANNM